MLRIQGWVVDRIPTGKSPANEVERMPENIGHKRSGTGESRLLLNRGSDTSSGGGTKLLGLQALKFSSIRVVGGGGGLCRPRSATALAFYSTYL